MKSNLRHITAALLLAAALPVDTGHAQQPPRETRLRKRNQHGTGVRQNRGAI